LTALCAVALGDESNVDVEVLAGAHLRALAAMDRHSMAVIVQRAACTYMAVLARHRFLRRALVQADAPARVLTAMDYFEEDTALLTEALYALTCLADGGKYRGPPAWQPYAQPWLALARAGAVERLLNLMARHAADARFQHIAIVAIRHFAVSADNRLPVAERVLEAMKQHLDDIEVQIAGCDHITSCCLVPDAKRAMLDSGAADRVQQARLVHPDDKDIEEAADRASALLTGDSFMAAAAFFRDRHRKLFDGPFIR
jgi:hypothetical protein